MIRTIEFLGEGPSPREVAEHYIPSEPLPVFSPRYSEEFEAMYRSNGLIRVFGLLPMDFSLTTDEVLRLIKPEIIKIGNGSTLYGPAAELLEPSSGKLVLGGLGIYMPASYLEPGQGLSCVS